MALPNLMPHQTEPLNADIYAQHAFMFLRKKWGLKNAVETGTCFGSTTMFLSGLYEKVLTLEISEEYLGYAKQRISEMGDRGKNIITHLGDSSKDLLPLLFEHNFRLHTFYFGDAHWKHHCPLLAELEQIGHQCVKPVIAIHDWKVPDNPELGFDSYNGQPFTFEWIKKKLDFIYGEKMYDYYYNSQDRAEGAKRGLIYITPKQHVTLIVGVYDDPNEARDAELKTCLKNNHNINNIDCMVKYSDRPTFNQLFEIANAQLKDDMSITIIANSDIYFNDESIEFIKRHITPDTCFALSRWDVKRGNAVLFNRADSQDAWVFQGRIPQMESADFSQGVAGCDNAIAHIIGQNGYKVINPAKTIKSFHLHETNVRNYNPMVKVPPPYKLIPPIAL